MDAKKIVLLRRDSVEAEAGGTLTFLDPNGMRWFGKCGPIDQGPQVPYTIEGTITSGPEEWKGLTVCISDPEDGEHMMLTPKFERSVP